jgi:tetratricopeptide (TPR) repeat protein
MISLRTINAVSKSQTTNNSNSTRSISQPTVELNSNSFSKEYAECSKFNAISFTALPDKPYVNHRKRGREDYLGGNDLYKQALDLEDHRDEVSKNRFDEQYKRIDEKRKKVLEQAIDKYDAAIEHYKKSPDTWENKEIQLNRSVMRKALSLADNDHEEEGLHLLDETLKSINENPKLKSQIFENIQRCRDDAVLYGTFFTHHINLRHRQYKSLKDSFDVLDMAEDITKNSPLKKDYKYLHTAEILNLKGEANLELGKRNRAEHILAEAVRIFETQPQLEKLNSTAKLKCFYNYADALSKNGKTQKAKQYYIKALEIGSKDEGIEGNHWRDQRKISLPLIYATNCCLVLANMAKTEGNKEEAKQYLQKGIDIVLKFEEATEATKYKLGILTIERANILNEEGKTKEAESLLIEVTEKVCSLVKNSTRFERTSF